MSTFILFSGGAVMFVMALTPAGNSVNAQGAGGLVLMWISLASLYPA